MSHQALFTAVLSLEKPLLTSLTAASASSPVITTIPAPSSSSKSSKSSTSKSKSKPAKSRRPSISSDSDSSFPLHPPTFTQRKRKYDDATEVPGDTPLNKKLRRQQQNRQAAHTSRIKKKMQMDALQKQVTDLIAANRLLQEKVNALQSEVASNRALLQIQETSDISQISTPISNDATTPITHDSPMSTTSTSPESPISPIPITMKSPISPLSDSDASMDTSSSTSTSLPPFQLLSTPTSTSPIDVIPSSTRCYDPAAIALSPQCQQVENGMSSMIKPSPSMISQPLTWSQFTMILCILNTVWTMIQTSSTTNTFRMKNIPSTISLIQSRQHHNPTIQVHNQTVNHPSIHLPLTSRMSGIETDTNTMNCMSNLCAMILIMAMSRVTQQSITTVT